MSERHPQSETLDLIMKHYPDASTGLDAAWEALKLRTLEEWQLALRPGDHVASMGDPVEGECPQMTYCEILDHALAVLRQKEIPKPPALEWYIARVVRAHYSDGPKGEVCAMLPWEFDVSLTAGQFERMKELGFPETRQEFPPKGL
jgi:hypothetical protein